MLEKRQIKVLTEERNSTLRALREKQIELHFAERMAELDEENGRDRSRPSVSVLTERRPHPKDTFQVVDWSPALAKQFSKSIDLAGERGLNVNRVQTLQTYIDMRPIPLIWSRAHVEDLAIRINGNHTLFLSLNNPDIFIGTKVFLSDFYCTKGIEEATLLYEQYDATFSKRTPNEALGPCIVTSGLKLNRVKISPTAAAIAVAKSGVVPTLSIDQRRAIINEEIDYFYWLYDTLGDELNKTNNKYLGRYGTSAVMFMTYVADQVLAERFWRGVFAGGSGSLSEGDPCRMLHEWCQTHDSRSSNSIERHLPDIGASISCWNAFAENRPCKQVYKRIKGKLPRVQRMSKEDTTRFGLLTRSYAGLKTKKKHRYGE